MRKAKETDSLVDRRRARGLAGDLDNIILKTLSKQPEQRYASVEALAQDLRRYLDGQPVQARAQSLGYRARKYLRRHAVGLGLGFAVTSVLAVALAIVSWQASRAVKEASRAQAMQDFVIALLKIPAMPRRRAAWTCARCWKPAWPAPTPSWPRSRRRGRNCSD
jgi:serine/threonine-protein kinase